MRPPPVAATEEDVVRMDAHTVRLCELEHSEADTLTGGDVLPGFTLPRKDFFAELDRTAQS